MKKKYVLISIGVLLIICAYYFNYFYQIERQRKIDDILSHQKIHAKQAVKSFEELFEKWNSVLYYLSNDKDIIKLDGTGKQLILKIYNVFKNEIKSITRTDSNGAITYTVPIRQDVVGKDISQQVHMKKILTDHRPVVSDVFDAVQGYKAIVLHYPVFEKSKFVGTVAVLLDFEQITREILDDVKIGKSGHAWMISNKGIQLYSPNKEDIGESVYKTSKGSKELLLLSQKMMQGKEGTEIYNDIDKTNQGKTSAKIAYYIPVKIGDTFWSLAVIYSIDEITASLRSYRDKLIFLFSLIFICGLVISYFTFKTWLMLKESKIRETAELALARERTLLRALIDNLPSGVFIKDKDYKKIVANKIHLKSMKGHLNVFGLNSDVDIMNKTDFDIFPRELAEKFFEDDSGVIEQGKAIINQVEPGIGPDNNKVWLLVSKVPIRDDLGNIIGLVGITTDITEQKQTEEALIIAKNKAEESDRLKTAFLNNISHEIRTPLNAILGFTNLMKEKDLSHSMLVKYIEITEESGLQLLSIITDLINIATIEAGQLKISFMKTDVNWLLWNLHEQFIRRAQAKGISLNIFPSIGTSELSIETDVTKLSEILSNLIANAIKFTTRGYVSFGYEIKENVIQFSVEDTGIGIRKEFQDNIFDRFYQIDKEILTNLRGTGLGLTISKAYVEALGGKIWLISEPAHGTTFYFTIPLTK